MIAFILFVIAAVVFGVNAFFPVPSRAEWPRSLTSLGLCVLSIAFAVWHGGY